MALAALLLATSAAPAFAQAYSCYRPSEPRIPSGYSITEHDMDGIIREAERYEADMKNYIDCLKREAEHAVSEFRAVFRDYERTAEEFKRR